ncbi:hypothetical protein KPL70_023663 [Citrus sinensis]|nr:hypothetical protein KPL70_023663 [Citrus sinensis]
MVESDCSLEEDHEEQGQHENAIKISNYEHVFAVFKGNCNEGLYATMTTGSIAITASTQVAMKNTNIYKYPIGKLMVQPVGIIIFAAVMATLGLQVLIQAVEELVKDEYNAIGMVVFNHDWCFCCQTFPLDLLQELRNTIVRTYAKVNFWTRIFH